MSLDGKGNELGKVVWKLTVKVKILWSLKLNLRRQVDYKGFLSRMVLKDKN